MLRPHLRIRFELNKLPIHLNRNYPARIRSLLNHALTIPMLYFLFLGHEKWEAVHAPLPQRTNRYAASAVARSPELS